LQERLTHAGQVTQASLAGVSLGGLADTPGSAGVALLPQLLPDPRTNHLQPGWATMCLDRK